MQEIYSHTNGKYDYYLDGYDKWKHAWLVVHLPVFLMQILEGSRGQHAFILW